jgi:hypothetical protein
MSQLIKAFVRLKPQDGEKMIVANSKSSVLVTRTG